MSDDLKHTLSNPEDTAPAILSPITQALNNSNVTLERLANKLNSLIDAKKTIGVNAKGRPIKSDDNTSQLKAIDMSAKMLQAYPSDTLDITHNMGETAMSMAVTVFRAQHAELQLPDKTEDKEIEDDKQ